MRCFTRLARTARKKGLKIAESKKTHKQSAISAAGVKRRNRFGSAQLSSALRWTGGFPQKGPVSDQEDCRHGCHRRLRGGSFRRRGSASAGDRQRQRPEPGQRQRCVGELRQRDHVRDDEPADRTHPGSFNKPCIAVSHVPVQVPPVLGAGLQDIPILSDELNQQCTQNSTQTKRDGALAHLLENVSLLSTATERN